MRILIQFFSLIILSISITLAQSGSVELRTGGGTLVNTFQSIQQAYDAIPAPLTQSYIIEILPAYNQSSETIPITLTQKDGASATNTITIRPAAGNSGEQISASSTNNIIIFNGADYVILDGRPGGVGNQPNFKIENLATTGTNSNTILFQNGATNNIVRFVHIVNNTQNTAGPRAIMFGTGDASSFNTIINNRIQGGRSGIGIAGSTASPIVKTVIRSNEIFDWGYAGIWLVSGASDTDIDSNRIYQTVGVNNTIVSGIIMTTTAGAEYNIRRNWIYDLRTTATTTSQLRGIYSAGPATGSTFNISNNMISNTIDNGSAAQTVTGIEFLGSNTYNLNLYYNTILIGGTHTGGTAGATTSAGIRIGATQANVIMKNNIAINKRTGGNVNHIGFALVSTTIPTNLDINYNCYFANGTNSFAAWWGSTGYTNLAAYKTAVAPQEQNTIFKDVSFNSLTNLHLIAPSDGDPELAGTRIIGILTDFDGQVRDTVNPYRGADEATTIPVELVSFSSLIEGNNVKLLWTTATELNNYGFEIERKTNDGEFYKIGFVPGNGTTTQISNYSFIDKNLDAGKYFYRLKQIDFNGAYNYSNEIEVDFTPLSEFYLAQNYPNPFNPITKIRFGISENTIVKLVVYNLLGEVVTTLINQPMVFGNYEVEFDAGGLPTGMYIYKLEAGGNSIAKKMILMK
ncbi:MAG: T9SS type A sorting domain-containing protein [Ignavibacterium sp.]|nr:T9SS type A sorting domain-containing protein [Ignavibacterium sp.]MDW8375191.1 T9SS type A sorting domain-containing protein [Ignavibacteriales bacterium]